MEIVFIVLVILFICLSTLICHLIDKSEENYEKYIENPRSPEEVSNWIEKQKWYPQFKENCKEDNDGRDDEEILNGKCGKDTISMAFVWSNTKEGRDFWMDAEHKFLKWYFGQNIPLTKFKEML